MTINWPDFASGDNKDCADGCFSDAGVSVNMTTWDFETALSTAGNETSGITTCIYACVGGGAEPEPENVGARNDQVHVY